MRFAISWPMTYSSRMSQISFGVGRSDFAVLPDLSALVSSRMMSLHSSMHSSQMNTEGPAISFLTSCWLLPQKEQYRSFSPEFFSVIYASFLRVGAIAQHLVHQAIGHRLVRRHEIVAVRIARDGLHALPGVQRQHLVQPTAQVQDFLGMDFDVRCLALKTAHGLMDHDARIGQAETLALRARGEQERTH